MSDAINIVIAQGATGPEGPRGDAGPGVPAGGTAGQVLKKVDDIDYNTQWANPTGGSSAAEDITIEDVGEYYPTKNVEAALSIVGENMAAIMQYATVTEAENAYTIDLASKPVKNVRMAIVDDIAKTVVLSNMPSGDCELFIELTYTNAAAITWFSGITWLSGSAPALTAGKVYRLVFFKVGNNWHGNCVGGW